MPLLPGTDLDLSTVGLGCWAIGGLWWGDDVDDARSLRTLHAAIDAGVNWLDTAPLYGHGHADTLVAQLLKERPGALKVATKVGVRWDNDGHAESDLSPDHIADDIDASLRRLGVETIDLLQIHWPCQRGTPVPETMAALERAREAGKVRWVGLCNYNVPGLAACRAHGAVHSLQTPYSALRREFEGGLQQAVAEGGPGGGPLGVLAYEPLCRGLLTGKYGPRDRFPDSDLRARDDRFQGSRYLRALTIVSRLGLIARRWQVPLAALSLAWVLRQPGVSAVIAGARRPEQVDENASAMALAAQDERDWAAVDRVISAYRG